MDNISIEVKLERNEWIKLNFTIGYTNPVVLFLTFVGIINAYAVVNFLSSNSLNIESFPFIQMGFAAFCLILVPVSTLIQANKNLKTNNWISQRVNYTIDSTTIKSKGETFDLTMNWSDVKSLKEIKNWFVIYTDKQRGFFIPKHRFNDNNQISSFKNILRNVEGVKMKLK